MESDHRRSRSIKYLEEPSVKSSLDIRKVENRQTFGRLSRSPIGACEELESVIRSQQ